MAEVSTLFYRYNWGSVIYFDLTFLISSFRTVEDFREWTNWLLYRGGIGVKGAESWEAWWEEELVLNLMITLLYKRKESLSLLSSISNSIYCLLPGSFSLI